MAKNNGWLFYKGIFKKHQPAVAVPDLFAWVLGSAGDSPFSQLGRLTV